MPLCINECDEKVLPRYMWNIKCTIILYWSCVIHLVLIPANDIFVKIAFNLVLLEIMFVIDIFNSGSNLNKLLDSLQFSGY